MRSSIYNKVDHRNEEGIRNEDNLIMKRTSKLTMASNYNFMLHTSLELDTDKTEN